MQSLAVSHEGAALLKTPDSVPKPGAASSQVPLVS